MPFFVVLDACVLVPGLLRDTLLRLAEAGFYRPLWSADILAEVRRTVLKVAPGVDSARVDRMLKQMNTAFTDAQVTGYTPLTAAMTNDEGDRHVLAAAVVGRAELIVTSNLRHFPDTVLAPFDLRAEHPDTFLLDVYEMAPHRVRQVLQAQAAATGRRGNVHYTVPDLLDRLTRTVPQFANHLRDHM